MIILLVLVFIRKELIAICVRLGNLFKALFASGVFGNDISKLQMLIVKIVFGLAISGVLFSELRLMFVCGCVE